MSDKIRLLVVEDNPADLRLIREMLADHGKNRFEARYVSRMDEVKPPAEDVDVVLLDLNLPDCRGVETCSRLRALLPAVPVVVLSGLSDEELALGAVRLGAQEYLIKGEADGPLLIRSLRYAMERQQAEIALRNSEAELRQRGEQLRQVQKMEALGRLAGGVAHEFNNLLTSILGFGRFAYEALPDGHPVRQDLREVIAAGERAADLTKELLAVARKQMVQVKPLDLNAVIRDMIHLLRRTLGEDIELDVVMGDNLKPVMADAGAIEQMVLNLVLNARDAMPRGGRLTIETARIEDRAKDGGLGWAELTVRDTGCGMSNEVRERAFEPFFSTKPKGQGTGLGLSTVYGIVQQFGGHIELTSKENEGTQFRIRFPCVADTPGSVETTVPIALPRGTETLLVVEDEESVRRFAVRVLRQQGYQVLEAGDAPAALALIADRTEPIALVFTDVIMPHMSGVELVERLRHTRAGLKVLYATGFSQNAVIRHGLEVANAAIILKPYDQRRLAIRVREVLDKGN